MARQPAQDEGSGGGLLIVAGIVFVGYLAYTHGWLSGLLGPATSAAPSPAATPPAPIGLLPAAHPPITGPTGIRTIDDPYQSPPYVPPGVGGDAPPQYPIDANQKGNAWSTDVVYWSTRTSPEFQLEQMPTYGGKRF